VHHQATSKGCTHVSDIQQTECAVQSTEYIVQSTEYRDSDIQEGARQRDPRRGRKTTRPLYRATFTRPTDMGTQRPQSDNKTSMEAESCIHQAVEPESHRDAAAYDNSGRDPSQITRLHWRHRATYTEPSSRRAKRATYTEPSSRRDPSSGHVRIAQYIYTVYATEP
jgi:hypothetical protein